MSSAWDSRCHRSAIALGLSYVPREPVRRRMAASGEARRVLVYGGRGALGSRCVQAFRARNWVTLRDGRCERQTLGEGGGWEGLPSLCTLD